MFPILTDPDVARLLTAESAVAIIEQALLARTTGTLVAPPRFGIQVRDGGLLFTAGAETSSSRCVGFRVYDTFKERSSEHAELVAVYDSDTGALKGVILGDTLGAWRTAAINAVAIKHLAPPAATRLGLLGSGFQARFHLQTALAVRDFARVKVYSPHAGRREAFAAEMTALTGRPVEAAGSAREVVDSADVLVCATKSSTPLFDASWLRPSLHINTIGPKLKGASELSPSVARQSHVLVTDSLDQVDAFTEGYFVSDGRDRDRMVELSDIMSGKRTGRRSPEDITLFCSVGLAGTEIVLANDVLHRSMRNDSAP